MGSMTAITYTAHSPLVCFAQSLAVTNRSGAWVSGEYRWNVQ
jgi:hypothetical protein